MACLGRRVKRPLSSLMMSFWSNYLPVPGADLALSLSEIGLLYLGACPRLSVLVVLNIALFGWPQPVSLLNSRKMYVLLVKISFPIDVSFGWNLPRERKSDEKGKVFLAEQVFVRVYQPILEFLHRYFDYCLKRLSLFLSELKSSCFNLDRLFWIPGGSGW